MKDYSNSEVPLNRFQDTIRKLRNVRRSTIKHLPKRHRIKAGMAIDAAIMELFGMNSAGEAMLITIQRMSERLADLGE